MNDPATAPVVTAPPVTDEDAGQSVQLLARLCREYSNVLRAGGSAATGAAVVSAVNDAERTALAFIKHKAQP